MKNRIPPLKAALILLFVSLAPLLARGQATHFTDDWSQELKTDDQESSLRDFQTRLRSSLFLSRNQSDWNKSTDHKSREARIASTCPT
ncbi:MAG: hypothetical protein MUC83_14010 [Pirellula sp.]|nr:hypothetical protein [Pirellula sp.]